MKAIYLVKKGPAAKAFEIRETDIPSPSDMEVLIKVQAFGLNFADVLARLGLYPDAPKMPAILGYDVVGQIESLGKDVKDLKVGDRVTAMTRFGGYAEYAITDYRGVAKIPEDMDSCTAASLTTQGGTAYYMAEEMVNIYPGDRVLVHAAAGGVGSLLCQMCKHKGAFVYGTAGSKDKLSYLESIGVDKPIGYRESDFYSAISSFEKDSGSPGLDIVFDPIGGSSFKKGSKLLSSGGRMVLFGAAALTGARNIWQKLQVAKGFGLKSPISLLSSSKSVIGVNMLRIADNRPEVLNRVLKGTVKMATEKTIQPLNGGVYNYKDLDKAHSDLEQRKTMGKLIVEWN